MTAAAAAASPGGQTCTRGVLFEAAALASPPLLSVVFSLPRTDQCKFSRRTRTSTCGEASRGAPPTLHYYYYCQCFQALSERFNPIYCTSQSTEAVLLHAVCTLQSACLSVCPPTLQPALLGSGLVAVVWRAAAEQLPWSGTVTHRCTSTLEHGAFTDSAPSSDSAAPNHANQHFFCAFRCFSVVMKNFINTGGKWRQESKYKRKKENIFAIKNIND